MTKQALRKQLREKRKALLPTLREEKNLQIARKLLELKELKDAKSVLFYVSTPEEVDTHFAIKEVLKQGKKVFVPKLEKDEMKLCPLANFEELSPGTFGILEPCESTAESHPKQIDLFIIPGIAFDKKGNRLGQGKGHYDRLLKETKGIKVGLAFEEQVLEELPIETHDVPLDLLITDTHTFTF